MIWFDLTCIQPGGEYIYHGYVYAQACEASRIDINGEHITVAVLSLSLVSIL